MFHLCVYVCVRAHMTLIGPMVVDCSLFCHVLCSSFYVCFVLFPFVVVLGGSSEDFDLGFDAGVGRQGLCKAGRVG